MTVILFEKKLAAEDFASAYNIKKKGTGFIEIDSYTLTWTSGHLVQLCMPDAYGEKEWKMSRLPFIPAEFKLSVIMTKNAKRKLTKDKRAEGQLKVIGGLFKQCNNIIVATDPGREGELIFRYVYHYLACKKPYRRLWTSSLTESAIKKAMNNLKEGSHYDNLYLSAKARSEADWIVGLNATRALSLCFGAGAVLTAGRVQSPVLSLICQRYLDNKNHVQSNFYTVLLQINLDGHTFVLESNFKTANKSEAVDLQQKVNSSSGEIKVQKYETKESSINTPLLHDLASLQKLANKYCSYDMAYTLSLAQSLYEKKLISYPRTSSQYIDNDTLAYIPALIKDILQTKKWGGVVESYPDQLNKRTVDPSKVTDHHALITTENKDISGLSPQELVIYELIQLRMLESFYYNGKVQKASLVIVAAGQEFVLNFKNITEPGWMIFDEKNTDKEQKQIPTIKDNAELQLITAEVKEGKTSPKPLYTDETILIAMETCGKDIEDAEIKQGLSAGIGTAATRAPLMTMLYDRKYIEKTGKSIKPTAQGLQLFKSILGLPISSVDITGQWETALEGIERGTYQYSEFSTKIGKLTEFIITAIKKKALT